MKQLIALTIALLLCGSSFAQKTTTSKNDASGKKVTSNENKSCLGGSFRTARYVPIEGVQVFIYATDSSAEIIASGYSDATGVYETNNVMPRKKYNVKLVYPTTGKAVNIPGLVINKGVTDISLRADAPAADTAIQPAAFLPKPVEKVKGKKK